MRNGDHRAASSLHCTEYLSFHNIAQLLFNNCTNQCAKNHRAAGSLKCTARTHWTKLHKIAQTWRQNCVREPPGSKLTPLYFVIAHNWTKYISVCTETVCYGNAGQLYIKLKTWIHIAQCVIETQKARNCINLNAKHYFVWNIGQTTSAHWTAFNFVLADIIFVNFFTPAKFQDFENLPKKSA